MWPPSALQQIRPWHPAGALFGASCCPRWFLLSSYPAHWHSGGLCIWAGNDGGGHDLTSTLSLSQDHSFHRCAKNQHSYHHPAYLKHSEVSFPSRPRHTVIGEVSSMQHGTLGNSVWIKTVSLLFSVPHHSPSFPLGRRSRPPGMRNCTSGRMPL